MTINYLILVDNIDHMNEQVQYTILNVSKMSLIFRFKNILVYFGLYSHRCQVCWCIGSIIQ